MTKRRKPKQERSLKRYHHILDTAAQVFEDIGVESATTNFIADQADVSIGSLYQYFPNKEAILEGLVERYIDAYRTFNFEKFGILNSKTQINSISLLVMKTQKILNTILSVNLLYQLH